MAAPASHLFFQLTVILLVAAVGHLIIRRFHQPAILGEIAIGIVLGPTLAVPLLKSGGLLSPAASGLFDPELLALFATLGTIFLLFLIGLETDVKAIYRKRNVLVAVGGVVAPLLFGFVLAYAMIPDASLSSSRFLTSAFVGASLVATSTAIAGAILHELDMVRTEVASTIMGATIIDDILSLLVLSVTVGLAEGTVDVLGLAARVAFAVAFIGLVFYLGVRYLPRVVGWLHAKFVRPGHRHGGFVIAIAVAFSFATVAEAIGLSAVIGAFLAGAMFSTTTLRQTFHDGVAYLGAVFAPAFFISLGLLVDVWNLNGNLLLFGYALMAVAFFSKLAGCGLTARVTGMPRRASWAVGFGMIPRGEVGLITAVVAQQQGIIGADLFSVIVLVMIVVSLLPAPLLRRSLLLLRVMEEPSPPIAAAASEPE